MYLVSLEKLKINQEKQRIYNKVKRTNNKKHWEEFKQIRKQVKSKLDESHQNYVSQLLEVDEDGERKNTCSWKNVLAIHKSKKRDSCGIATLN